MKLSHEAAKALFRCWPFPRGAGRIIDKLFSGLTFDEQFATVRTTDGFYITVMPNEHIGRHIYLSREFDRSTAETIIKFAQPGDTLLDIGANIGYVSGCFLQNVARSAVIAVEPQPKIIDLLCQNLAQFRDRHVIVQAAVSDKTGTGWLEINGYGNLGASRLGEKSDRSVSVPLITASELIADKARIDLIKIDVEGHEEAVIRSLAPHLGRLQTRMVLFEDHTTKAAPDETIGSVFRKLNYQVFAVKKGLTSLALVSVKSAEDCTSVDYVALAHPLGQFVRNIGWAGFN